MLEDECLKRNADGTTDIRSSDGNILRHRVENESRQAKKCPRHERASCATRLAKSGRYVETATAERGHFYEVIGYRNDHSQRYSLRKLKIDPTGRISELWSRAIETH